MHLEDAVGHREAAEDLHEVGLAAALAAEVTQRQDLEGVAHRGAEEGHLVGEGPEEVEEGGEEQEVAQE